MSEAKKHNQCLRLKEALLLMHKLGTYLMQMHTNTGPEFFVIPGGRVRSDDAAKIIARPDVVPHDNGLFPGIAQSWKLLR
jgi:MOSC domain-containing protein YiiM